MFKVIVLCLIAIANAHEGHHEPKSMPAPKGGITRANEHYFFEYVHAASGGVVYLYDFESKPVAVEGIQASADFEIPRKGTQKATITPSGQSWKLDAKLPKTHRLTLKFKINDKGHADTLTFTVEPK